MNRLKSIQQSATLARYGGADSAARAIILTALILLVGMSGVRGQEKDKDKANKERFTTIEVPASQVKQYLKDIEDSCNKESELRNVMTKSRESFQQFSRVSTNSLPVPELIAEFKNTNKDWKYRYIVLQKMAKSKDERIIKPTIESLKDKKGEIRGLSTAILGELKADEAIDSLLELLDDTDRQVRMTVPYSLGKIGDAKAIEPILENFNRENDLGVKIETVKSLVNFKTKETEYFLVQILEKDPSPDVRAQAAWVLGEFKSTNSVLPLSKSLSDRYVIVGLNAAQALGKIKDKRSVTYLTKVLDRNMLNIEATRALGEIGDPSATEFLKGLLNNSNEKLKNTAFEAINKIEKVKSR